MSFGYGVAEQYGLLSCSAELCFEVLNSSDDECCSYI